MQGTGNSTAEIARCPTTRRAYSLALHGEGEIDQYRQTGAGQLLILTNSRWRVNLLGRPEVEVTRHSSRRLLARDALRGENSNQPMTRLIIKKGALGGSTPVHRGPLTVGHSRILTKEFGPDC